MKDRSRSGLAVLLLLVGLVAASVYLVWRVHNDDAIRAELDGTTESGPPGSEREVGGTSGGPRSHQAVASGQGHRFYEWGGSSNGHDRFEDPRLLPTRVADFRDPDDQPDPQFSAMLRSHRLVGAQDGGVPYAFFPRRNAAVVTEVDGSAPSAGEQYDVRVLPVRSGRFNCLVRVRCGDRIVYPDAAQNAGFVDCELSPDGRPIRAHETGHTAGDGDPQLDLDLESGTLIVSDHGDGVEGFRVQLQLGQS